MPKRWTSIPQQEFLEGEIPGFLKARKESAIYRFLADVNERWFAKWPERALQAEDGLPVPLTPEEKVGFEKAIDTRKTVSRG